MKQQTLLAHLALQKKFSDKYENIAVEALGHILSESDAARHVLSDVLRTGGAEVGEIAQGENTGQRRGGDHSPDLAGFAMQHNRRAHVLIEAKFWAGLTDNQPVAYLERLPEARSSHRHSCSSRRPRDSSCSGNEMCRLVKAKRRSQVRSARQTEEKNLRSATVGGKRRLMLTSWTYSA